MSLKNKPICAVDSAVKDDIQVLKEALLEVCDDYSPNYRQRTDLLRMPKLELCLGKHGGFQST
jgi:hypothetical protein